MIVAEHMKRTVHYKSEQLFSGPDALSPGVLAGNLGANIHVTDNSSPATNSAEPEGDHVRWSLMPEVAPIQPRDGGAADESDREHRISHLFRP